MSRMGLGMRVSWRDVEQVGGQERNDLRHRKNGSIVLLERKKGGHVGKNGTEVERPSPTEVGQLKKNLCEKNRIDQRASHCGILNFYE
jgi:hypothetical protein